MLTHFSLFTGIGGIDLAAEWAGFTTVGQCEIDEFCYRLLEKHWPGVERWRDIKNVTAMSIRDKGTGCITLMSGGFPCQPHSLAGKRTASNDERDLWGEFAQVICEIRPKWVLAENVPGLLSSENGRFFGRVLWNLAEMGYYAGWSCYGANSIGGYHQRQRVFIVAYSNEQRCNSSQNKAGVVSKTPAEWPEKWSWVLRSFRGRSGRVWIAPESIFERVDYGIPSELDRLRALGNAVDPRQVYPILKVIANIENEQLDAHRRYGGI